MLLAVSLACLTGMSHAANLTTAREQLDAMVGSNGSGANWDGSRGRGTPGGAPVAANAGSGANVAPGRVGPGSTPGRTTGQPPAPENNEPGFFGKLWNTVKAPNFLVPAGSALAFGAMGAMIAGPLGAITGAVIGGLLGFIFTKAMG